MIEEIMPVRFENGRLMIIDQTRLPVEEKYIELKNSCDVWEAIRSLQVRGAPAIGIAAAFGLYIALRHSIAVSHSEFLAEFRAAKEKLASARPTAVNLFWALDRQERRLSREIAALGGKYTRQFSEIDDHRPRNVDDHTIRNSLYPEVGDRLRDVDDHSRIRGSGADFEHMRRELLEALLDEAMKIRQEDEDACKAMGEFGLSLLKPGMGILTHCNAGALATARYGTALSPIHLGQMRGYGFKVFADETRPLLQGARLTAWELMKAGVDVSLICDNMAASVMKKGWVQAVLTGCDRMAGNGDGANKIGTSALAILAKEFGIPFYMFVPTSTIDMKTASGEDIPIELREGDEIRRLWYEKPMAPEGVKTWNPAFDVTDHSYITAVVTERGIVWPPFDEGLRNIMEVQGAEGLRPEMRR
ncbi:methylthioribose-1-phosphate isomerase [Clostridia bacterium]|nr:methylthioribose-1-phosphate isomerase [Clostridia bacterium]